MYQSTLLLVIVLASYAASTATDLLAKNVCYDEYGCFTTGPPFGLTLARPIALLPESPGMIYTRFLLYTRESTNESQMISRYTTLGTWSRDRPTKILVHGFLDTVNSTWWSEMKDALLQAEDCNVILIDWSQGNHFPYTQAAANAQIVGVDIALLVNKMIKEHNSQADDFHIVAHSMGAAVAGYAGYRISGLGRITGLDPASPLFENTDPIVHLDRTDAKFVDIIHTDGTPNINLGFGTLTPLGHVDFYPNGGANQPSCPKTSSKFVDAIITMGSLGIFGPMDIQGFFNTTMCSHFAAVHLFTNSILNRCSYRAFSCESDEAFQQGKCSLSGNEGNFMGYDVSPYKALGRLFLDTQRADKAPFCIHHYQVSLVSSSKYWKTRGQLRLTLIGSQNTESVLFDPEETLLTANSTETRYLPLETDLNTIQRVSIAFERSTKWLASLLNSNEWAFTYVVATDADRQISVKFCPEDKDLPLESGGIASFSPC